MLWLVRDRYVIAAGKQLESKQSDGKRTSIITEVLRHSNILEQQPRKRISKWNQVLEAHLVSC